MNARIRARRLAIAAAGLIVAVAAAGFIYFASSPAQSQSANIGLNTPASFPVDI